MNDNNFRAHRARRHHYDRPAYLNVGMWGAAAALALMPVLGATSAHATEPVVETTTTEPSYTLVLWEIVGGDWTNPQPYVASLATTDLHALDHLMECGKSYQADLYHGDPSPLWADGFLQYGHDGGYLAYELGFTPYKTTTTDDCPVVVPPTEEPTPPVVTPPTTPEEPCPEPTPEPTPPTTEPPTPEPTEPPVTEPTPGPSTPPSSEPSSPTAPPSAPPASTPGPSAPPTSGTNSPSPSPMSPSPVVNAAASTTPPASDSLAYTGSQDTVAWAALAAVAAALGAVLMLIPAIRRRRAARDDS